MKIIKTSIARESAVLRQIKKYNTKLCISTQSANIIIIKSEISHLRADSNYCVICLIDGSEIICSKTLKEISGRLGSSNFIRVHKSFVVNADEITSLDASYTELTVRNGSKIPISRSRKSEVRNIVSIMFD